MQEDSDSSSGESSSIRSKNS
jgi:hypothetical protein